MEQKGSKFRTLFIEIGTGIIFLGIIFLAMWFVPKKIAKIKKENVPNSTTPTKTEESEKWEDEGVRIPGNYADSEIIKTSEGYRIYYALEPEVQGFNGQIYTATSKEGITWSEGKEIMKQATFPSVLKLSNGKFRMYYQGSIPGNLASPTSQGGPPQNGIVSAISDDGVNWTGEEGLRIKQGQKPGYDDENVGAPTVEILEDGTFLMIYRGSAGENSYGKKDEKRNKPAAKDYLISAVSKDGLIFESKEIVIDSENDKMRDQIDGPELTIDGEKIKLYCNSYEGVYVLNLDKNGKAASEPQIIIKSTGPNYAPSDVTVIKMDNIWRMFYGLHTKGIHSAKRTK